jgi:hypothetical protein
MFRLGNAGGTERDVNGATDAALQFKDGRSRANHDQGI